MRARKIRFGDLPVGAFFKAHPRLTTVWVKVKTLQEHIEGNDYARNCVAVKRPDPITSVSVGSVGYVPDGTMVVPSK